MITRLNQIATTVRDRAGANRGRVSANRPSGMNGVWNTAK